MAFFGSKKNTCPNCGTELKKEATFCHNCGTAVSTGTIHCGQCHKEIPANATFCPYCGNRVSSVAPPQIDANRWRKREGDFATRIEVDDLRGILRRHLIIEPGTRAILLVDGANAGVVPPGKYAFDDLGKKLVKSVTLGLGQTITAILIDDGPCELSFDIPDLYTNDPMRIGFSCKVVAKLNPVGDAPFRFMNAMLKSRSSVTVADMETYLLPEIRNVAEPWIAGHSVASLNTGLTLKQRLEQDIEMTLNASFERSGLQFESLRAFNFAHEHYDALRQTKEKYFLDFEEKATELEGRKLLFDVFNQNELQDIFEETKKVEHYEKRAAVWARMRDAVLSDKMDELRSEDEMEIFLRERDRSKLIADTKWEELKRTLREHAEDHNRARAHLLAKLDIEQRYELKMAELVRQRDFTAAEFDAERERVRRELDLEQELELKRWEHRLNIKQQEASLQRSEEEAEAAHRRKIEIENALNEYKIKREKAKTDAEIHAIEREEDKLDMEMALWMKREMDAMKLARMEREQLLALQKQERELELQLRAERERTNLAMERDRLQADIELESKQADHSFELTRIEKLATLSAEALISLSGAPQAEMIASLKKTEALRGMDAEAILAMAAENSPEVAKAFAEKFRAMAQETMSEQERALFEKLLAEKDSSTAQVLKAMEDSARRESETARHAIDRTADIAKEYARASGQQSPTVVYPPQSNAAGTVVSGGQTTSPSGVEVVICPKCQTKSQPGTQFCSNCGHQFFER